MVCLIMEEAGFSNRQSTRLNGGPRFDINPTRRTNVYAKESTSELASKRASLGEQPAAPTLFVSRVACLHVDSVFTRFVRLSSPPATSPTTREPRPPLPHPLPSIPLLPSLTLSSSLATVLSAFSLQDLTILSFSVTREPTSHVFVRVCVPSK